MRSMELYTLRIEGIKLTIFSMPINITFYTKDISFYIDLLFHIYNQCPGDMIQIYMDIVRVCEFMY
jgi:hypothetical protein